MANNFTPKYKDLKFKSEKEFKKWLKEKATRHIEFVDNGQDLTEIWVDDEGEILHCHYQSAIWCGIFIRISTLRKGKGIDMWFPDNKNYKVMDFIVENNTKLK